MSALSKNNLGVEVFVDLVFRSFLRSTSEGTSPGPPEWCCPFGHPFRSGREILQRARSMVNSFFAFFSKYFGREAQGGGPVEI
jgi:hypothetical protein